jgi:hypothetical protein
LNTEERGDRFGGLEERYRDYTVYDQHYERLGKVDDLFVDEYDRPEYIGVKTGFLAAKSTLIPMEIARVNDLRKLIEVAADRHTIESAPSFDDDEEITPEHEARIYGYFGLEHPGFEAGRGGYGDYYTSEPYTGEDLSGAVDTEYGERREESLASPTGSDYTGEPSDTAPAGAEPGRAEGKTSGPLGGDEPPRETGASRPDGVRLYKRVRGTR